MNSAIRLLAPMTLVGWTALSVDTSDHVLDARLYRGVDDGCCRRR